MAYLESVDFFLNKINSYLKHSQERHRAIDIITRWSSVWSNNKRTITYTSSNHGLSLSFNQLIGSVWSHVFVFHLSKKRGLFMKGPDLDRIRKSHKHRNNPMDRTKLDAVFELWSLHPESRRAGNAVEFYLTETPNDVWEACLQEVLSNL